MNKFVVVEASGTRYFGTLVEVGEEEAILKTKQRWVTVPVEQIRSIKEIDPAVLEEADFEVVDADEFVEGTPVGDDEPDGEANGEANHDPDAT